MNFLLPLFIATVFLTNRVSAEMIVIDLSKGFTWKAMFDAGFRPKHVWDGNFMCCQTGVEIGIRNASDGEVLEIGKGDIEFCLHEDHTMTLVSFFGREDLTVQEARERSELFARIFDRSITNRAVIRELEIKEAPRSPTFPLGHPRVRKTVDVDGALNAARTKDFRVFYSFSNLASKRGDVIGSLSISLADVDSHFRPRMTTPIQPPPGYEHISLAPDGVNARPAVRAAGSAAAAEGGAVASKDGDQSGADTVDRRAKTPEPSSGWWWKLGMLLLVMASLVFLIRALRR